MKLFLAILGLLFCFSCAVPGTDDHVRGFKSRLLPALAIYTVDGCEYVQIDRGICHKGNCKNPIHQIH